MRNQIIQYIPYKNKLRSFRDLFLSLPDHFGFHEKNILFTYSGRNLHWLHMGSELYSSFPPFRKAIDECREIILQIEDTVDILPLFNRTADDSFWSESNLLFVLSAIQISLSDLFRYYQILPNATLGTSLGEIAAAYCAGALTKNEAFIVVKSTQEIKKGAEREYIPILVNINLNELFEISHSKIYPFFELTENHCLAFINNKDVEEISIFLKSCNIDWEIFLEKTKLLPYHTHLLTPFKQEIYKHLKKINPKPLANDFFSSVYGKKIPKGTILEKDYWYDFQRYAVKNRTVFQAIGDEKKEYYIVQIGPKSIAPPTKETITNTFKSPKILCTLDINTSEENLFKKTKEKISNLGKKNYSEQSKINSIDYLLKNYFSPNNHYYQNPYPYLKFLRNNGCVHHIPNSNYYLILDYRDIEYVLKKPQIFSNKPYNHLDSVLLAKDPPNHKKVRRLLLPLFTKKNYGKVEKYTLDASQELIEHFPLNKPFNFVNQFSIPITKKVLSEFLGISSQDVSNINDLNHSHLYTISNSVNTYNFNRDIISNTKNDPFLAVFFECLNTKHMDSSTGVIKHLLHLKNEGLISMKESASLLRLLWFAGITTTSMLISSIVLKILKDSEIAQTIKDNDDLIAPFIEECLRLDSPESVITRLTKEEVTIHNYKIPKDSLLLLSIGGANRDENYFDEPEKIRFDRSFNKHLAFGTGIHTCLGLMIAKTEASAVIKSILEVLPSLQLVDEKKYSSFFPSHHFRGLEKLNVIFTDG